MQETKSGLAIFQGKEVRRILHKNEWWFSIIDAVEVLTESERPRKYWNDLKKKLLDEGCAELSEKIGQLKMEASDGKLPVTPEKNLKLNQEKRLAKKKII